MKKIVRWCAPLVVVAGALIGGGAESGAATNQQLDGMFSVHFPKAGQQRNVYTCVVEDAFCGVGELRGFGNAELDTVDDNFAWDDELGCVTFDQHADVLVLGTNARLTMTGAGLICFPGNSGNEPQNDSNQDYGHPSHWTAQLAVDDGSTGAFQGATGSLSLDFTAAGGVGIWTLSGSVAS